VSYLLRDRDWGTVPATIDALTVTESATSFDVQVGVTHLHGQSNGQLTFEVRATADATIQTNRCGLVVLQLRLEAELPGDPSGKFELEDQRNWSDASFSTYVASLLDNWVRFAVGQASARHILQNW
jgi:hypothetical protein